MTRSELAQDMHSRVAHVGEVDSGQLLSIIERAEQLDSEIKAVNDSKKELFAEARSNGFDVPTIKAVIKYRATPADKRDGRDILLGLYLTAVGEA